MDWIDKKPISQYVMSNITQNRLGPSGQPTQNVDNLITRQNIASSLPTHFDYDNFKSFSHRSLVGTSSRVI